MNKKISRSILFFSLTVVINTKTIIDPTIRLKPDDAPALAISKPIKVSIVEKVVKEITKNLTFDNSIQNQLFFDTRQVNGLDRNQRVFFPDQERLDPAGKDINARGKGVILGTEGSIRATFITQAQEVKEGKDEEETNRLSFVATMETSLTKGFINETGFLDTAQLTARKQFAFGELTWGTPGQKKYDLIFGKEWHPMFVRTCFPETISSNTGNPIDPFSSSSQFRFTYYNERFNIFAAVLSQDGPFSDGPDGFSSKYIRNAIVPNLHGQIQIKIGDHSIDPSLDLGRNAPRTEIGTGFDYKRLLPRIETNKGFKACESINSIAAMWYARVDWAKNDSKTWQRFYFKTKIIFADNATDFDMLGGYAVHTIDSVTDERTYTNLRTFSIWLDTAAITTEIIPTSDQTKSTRIEPGIFIGFTKNLGASKTIEPNITTEKRVFGIGTDISTVLRISPRLQLHRYVETIDDEKPYVIKDITIAAELEYTRAAYGTLNNKGKPINTIPIGNVRFLFSTFHYF